MARRNKHDRRRAPGESAATPARPAAGNTSHRAWIGPGLFLAGAALYGVFFYLTPLESLGGMRRGEFFTFLLFPDLLIEQWFGGPGQFALLDFLLDRTPILLTAAALHLAATAVGYLLLAALRADRGLTGLERFVFSAGVGLCTTSLYTLLVGLAGGLDERLWFIAPGVLAMIAALIVLLRRGSTGTDAENATSRPDEPCPGRMWPWLAAPFALVIVLGGMLPPVDFDVREYHLQAPKEFYLAGRIGFLPHNVYSAMPLGAEMLSLEAMVLLDDWWTGALAGKTAIAWFAPLGALALYACGRRFVSRRAGAAAALVYISTPWIVQVSTAGLVEGAYAFYLALAVYALLLARQESEPSWPRAALCGFLAGAAAACKYPAVVFVVAPVGVWLTWPRAGEKLNAARAVRCLALYSLAVLAACGPWFAKNAVLTGNPTYPLLANVFPSATRTAELDARWRAAHRPPNYAAADLMSRTADVLLRSEWLSPLLAPLAALAFCVRSARRLTLALAAYLAYVFLAWWLFTHRIDRFWVPALSLASLAAGVGATHGDHPAWRRAAWGLLITGLAANLLFVTAGAGGYNRYFVHLDRLRADPDRVDPWHLYLNAHSRPGEAVLAVGEAQVFDLETPVLYATTFDPAPFERIVSNRTADEIRAELERLHIAYVHVDWDEIARYRSPGNYGFTSFVEPAVFTRLVEQGVLAPPLPRIEGSAGEVYPVRRAASRE